MKLKDNIKTELVSFECEGATWYMKPLTLNKVKKIQTAFSHLEDESNEDLSPLMILFTDVLVGEDGELFDEVKEGMTFEELAEYIPLSVMTSLAEAIAGSIQTKKGN